MSHNNKYNNYPNYKAKGKGNGRFHNEKQTKTFKSVICPNKVCPPPTPSSSGKYGFEFYDSNQVYHRKIQLFITIISWVSEKCRFYKLFYVPISTRIKDLREAIKSHNRLNLGNHPKRGGGSQRREWFSNILLLLL